MDLWLKRTSLAMLVWFAFAPAGAAAQQTERNGTPVDAKDADVVLDAHASAKSVHFAQTPRAGIVLSGHNSRGGYTVQRRNIPAHPRAGSTYRDVDVHLQVTTQFVDPHAAPSAAPATSR